MNNATYEGDALFISGDRSKFMSKNDERQILQIFPNATIVWLKDCGPCSGLLKCLKEVKNFTKSSVPM